MHPDDLLPAVCHDVMTAQQQQQQRRAGLLLLPGLPVLVPVSWRRMRWQRPARAQSTTSSFVRRAARLLQVSVLSQDVCACAACFHIRRLPSNLWCGMSVEQRHCC